MCSDKPLVLLIDDDRDIHVAIEAILRPLGYRVIGCRTGPSGLAELRRVRPDIVLLDIMLSAPEEGIDLAREFRADPKFRNISVILISSIGNHVSVKSLLELPAAAYLEKPFQPEVLQATIERVLRSGGGVIP